MTPPPDMRGCLADLTAGHVTARVVGQHHGSLDPLSHRFPVG